MVDAGRAPGPAMETEGPEPARQVTGRSRRRMVIGSLGVLALVVIVGALASRQVGTTPGVQAAVDFELENVRRGEPVVSLADYRGRPVVLNFFASWCVPCRKEMPAFEAVHDRLGARVVFLGVNHQDQRSAAVDLLDKTGMSYPSGFDPNGEVGAAYGVYGMPTTVFISPEGKVLERQTGELSEQVLESTIERHFGT